MIGFICILVAKAFYYVGEKWVIQEVITFDNVLDITPIEGFNNLLDCRPHPLKIRLVGQLY